MQTIMLILSEILHHGVIAGPHSLPDGMQLSMNIMHGLFNGQFLFILEFIGKLFLLFAISAIISKIFKLDKVYEDSNLNENRGFH
jgi:hypothetical protein